MKAGLWGEGLEENYFIWDQFLNAFCSLFIYKIRKLDEVPPDIHNEEFCGWILLEYVSSCHACPLPHLRQQLFFFNLEYYKPESVSHSMCLTLCDPMGVAR